MSVFFIVVLIVTQVNCMFGTGWLDRFYFVGNIGEEDVQDTCAAAAIKVALIFIIIGVFLAVFLQLNPGLNAKGSSGLWMRHRIFWTICKYPSSSKPYD
jgi:hypothetical protein